MSVIELIFHQKTVNPLNDLKGVVYCIENTITNEKYIGVTTKSFNCRYSGGRWWEYTQNKLLRNAYQKYGKDAFLVSILENGLPKEDLTSVEAEYIYSLNTFCPNGYNLTYDTCPSNPSEGVFYRVSLRTQRIFVYQKDSEGFVDLNMAGGPCSEETKRKISLANKGKKRTPEQRARMALAGKGRKWAPETVDKRRRSLLGKHTKVVLQIDPETNQIVKEHSSIQNAASYLGLSSSSNLTSVCKGKQKTAGGYIFKYKT
jgi:group I intron endonuclease